jgi:nitrile hydratase
MPDTPSHPPEHSELSEMDVRVRALESLLTEKGYVDPAALDRIVEAHEREIGPHIGARIVARLGRSGVQAAPAR